MNRFRNVLLAAVLALSACDGSSTDDNCNGAKCDGYGDSSTYKLCAGVRGNGELITAHFGALARITEHFGLIDAASGGSSGSISLFITESVRMNPMVHDCGTQACSSEERGVRAGLLLKSFVGYIQHLTTTDEAAAIQDIAPVAARIQQEGVESLLQTNPAEGLAALTTILESPDLTNLINPDAIILLNESPDPVFIARELVEGIKSFGKFSTDSDRILFRPGILNFGELAEQLGRVGSFYASYGPADEVKMGEFLDACAVPGVGKDWFAVAAMPAGESTCGGLFDALVDEYRTAYRAAPNTFANRADDKIGTVMPALISTSVLTGDTHVSYLTALNDYQKGLEYTFTPNFDDVKMGYFGPKALLDRAAKNERAFGDVKTSKFMSLGEATWRKALQYSPAEPGLARAQFLDGQKTSAGGWSDLHPVQVLKNMGCENVVYVTRTGEESGFAIGVAKMLGMDESTQDRLYNLDNPASSYASAVSDAEATWCTDWNNQTSSDLVGITDDSYNAPLETQAAFFEHTATPYPHTVASTGLRGCTPADGPAQAN